MNSGVVILAPTIRTFTIILDYSQQYSTVGIGCCLLNLLLHYRKKFTFLSKSVTFHSENGTSNSKMFQNFHSISNLITGTSSNFVLN